MVEILKKLEGKKIDFIDAEAGTLYEDGSFYMEGKMNWYLLKEKEEPLHISLIFKCKELGADDTYDLILTPIPSTESIIKRLAFHFNFQRGRTIKHLSLYHFPDKKFGKVYENNILLKFSDGSSMLIQPQGYLPFINLYSEVSVIKEAIKGFEEKVVF